MSGNDLNLEMGLLEISLVKESPFVLKTQALRWFIRGNPLRQCHLAPDQPWDRLVWMDSASQREYIESRDDTKCQLAEFCAGILCLYKLSNSENVG